MVKTTKEDSCTDVTKMKTHTDQRNSTRRTQKAIINQQNPKNDKLSRSITCVLNFFDLPIILFRHKKHKENMPVSFFSTEVEKKREKESQDYPNLSCRVFQLWS